MPDTAAYRAMLKTITDSVPAAIVHVDSNGLIAHLHISKRPDRLRYYHGKPFFKAVHLIFGLQADTIFRVLADCRNCGQVRELKRFEHKTCRNMTEYYDWRFFAVNDGVIVCAMNVTESVCLEQEFAAISEQYEAANRDLFAAMSKLDFRLMEVDQAHKKLATLYRITSIVQRTVDEQEVLQEIIDGITSDLNYSYAAVLLIEEEPKELVLRASHGYPLNTRIPYGQGITWHSVLKREVVYVSDVRNDPRYITGTIGAVSEIAIPLIYADTVIGVLDVETTEERPLLPHDRDLLCSLAGQVALTIAHAKHVSSVQTQAITDGLTGLYNYRYFLSSLSREFKRAVRYERPLTLLMMDIDFFKRYNDTHGHNKGNEVLQQIAELMRHACRDVDFAVRYGGEEFCILLPETGLQEAQSVAERLRIAIQQHPFHGRQTQPGGAITISIGVAAFPDDAASDQELLEHADSALYLAKRTTRNCVITYKDSGLEQEKRQFKKLKP